MEKPKRKTAAASVTTGTTTKRKARPARPRCRYTPDEVHEIFRRFAIQRPEPKGELEHVNAFTLLVAVVLSAQATDAGVNKAKNVIALSEALIRDHGGEVPGDRDELTKLPGVGRKTANVVLNMAFGQPTMAVDTHIFRIGNRIGLAPGKTPEQVEEGLIRVIPPEYMRHAHHWLILHGRYVCKARRPECGRCVIADICMAAEKTNSIPAPLVELVSDALPEPV